jgi:hypothetical protein
MKLFKWLRVTSMLLLMAPAWSALAAPALTPTELVERAEDLLWGKTMSGEFDMEITTPSWTRVLSTQVWMILPVKSFVRIVAPEKDRGISSLRISSDMWNYVPAIERTLKIPPSLMLQPWLGSDFTNDDLVKESSFITDYTHRLIGETSVAGDQAYQVECLPKPNAAVVWGKVVYTMRKNDYVPLKIDYYDERGDLVRVLSYSEIRLMDGHLVPTRWEMRPLNKVGKKTTITAKTIIYNKPINSDIFSLRNLKQKG